MRTDYEIICGILLDCFKGGIWAGLWSDRPAEVAATIVSTKILELVNRLGLELKDSMLVGDLEERYVLE